MKSNWKIHSLVNSFKQGKAVAISLILGLAMGFAGGQAVHSSNEPSKDIKVPVHAEAKPAEKTLSERGFGFTFGVDDPLRHSFFRDAFFNDLDSFSDFPVSFGRGWSPSTFASASSFRIDANETANEITIKAEVPGIDEKDLDVSMTDSAVTIKGQRKRETGQEKDARRSERFYGTFERSLTFPCRVESDKAAASLKNGVLTIVIPKSQLAQKETKKLTIKTE